MAELSPADLAVLRDRARRFAAPLVLEHLQDAGRAVVLQVAERRYALPAEGVRAVLGPGPTSALPRRGHQLAGARTLGGELLAVADPGRVSGGGRLVEDADACFVVVLNGPEPLGLLAHDVTTAPAEDVLAGVAGSTASVVGVTDAGVVVLDPEALLADPRFRVPVPDRDAAAPSDIPRRGAS